MPATAWNSIYAAIITQLTAQPLVAPHDDALKGRRWRVKKELWFRARPCQFHVLSLQLGPSHPRPPPSISPKAALTGSRHAAMPQCTAEIACPETECAMESEHVGSLKQLSKLASVQEATRRSHAPGPRHRIQSTPIYYTTHYINKEIYIYILNVYIYICIQKL